MYARVLAARPGRQPFERPALGPPRVRRPSPMWVSPSYTGVALIGTVNASFKYRLGFTLLSVGKGSCVPLRRASSKRH